MQFFVHFRPFLAFLLDSVRWRSFRAIRNLGLHRALQFAVIVVNLGIVALSGTQ
jgi:hypothetical protein